VNLEKYRWIKESRTRLCINTDKNSNVIAWSTSDLVGVSRDIIEHRLQVSPNVKPKKQKLCKLADEKKTSSEG
jgi:recombinational DNA repair ATPase RecF